jgi:hypothetical protein
VSGGVVPPQQGAVLQPVPASPVSKPLVSPQPVPEDAGDQTSSLSPFKLLAKKPGVSVTPPVVQQPTPPVPQAIAAPTGATPLPPQDSSSILVAKPSREELLKQAAEAPAASFILPPPEVITTSGTEAKPLTTSQPLPIGEAVKPLLEKPVTSAFPPPPVRTAPLGTPTSPLPGQQRPFTPPPSKLATQQPARVPGIANERLQPSQQPLGQAKPIAQPTKLKGATGFGATPKRRGIAGTLVVGSFILLLVGSAVSYAMARSGTRVPLLYKQLSGLEPTGLATTLQALAYVEGRTRYQVQGEIQLEQQGALDSSGKPSLTTAGDTGPGDVYFLKSQIGQGEFSEKGGTHLTSIALTVNQSDPLQLAMQQKAGNATADNWKIYYSSSQIKELVAVKGSLVAKTLLNPVLKPIPLEKLLTSPTGELAYQKQVGTNSATAISAHSFTVNTDKLKEHFPTGAILENFTLLARYTWAQGSTPAGQVVSTELKGTITYQQKKYNYTSSWRYGNWDKPLDASVDASGGLSKVTGVDEAKPVNMASATAQMGILNLSSLPNTLTQDERGEVEVSTVITPSGEAITVGGTKITLQPPVPTKPVNSEAKARDTQRLKDLQDLKSALVAYKTAKGSFPISLSKLQTIEGGVLLSQLVPGYITKLPIDPTKTTYWYEYTSDGTVFSLKAVAEDPEGATVKKGSVYPYFEVTN